MEKNQAMTGRARGRLPFARQGWPFILGAAVLTLGAALLCWWIVAFIMTVLLLFVLNFFRDPDRATPGAGDAYICPADGKVVRAEATETGLRVDIFMNVFDVHVNRAPMAGRITHMEYTPGRFINAAAETASIENERNRFEMQTDDGQRIVFTQIAGLVARRIVSYVAVGDHVAAGQRIGMIRFGSRVDCEIPEGYTLRVKLGDRVTAGLTVLAERA